MGKIPKSPAFPKPPPHNLKTHIYNRQKALPFRKRDIRKALLDLIAYLQIASREISVYFVSEKNMAALHDRFFADPTPTDCISFPIGDSHLGEIFICPAIGLAYARQRKSDPYRETLLYLIHGVLHLIGFDDREQNDRKAMRKMEKRCMGHLMTRGISLDPISP